MPRHRTTIACFSLTAALGLAACGSSTESPAAGGTGGTSVASTSEQKAGLAGEVIGAELAEKGLVYRDFFDEYGFVGNKEPVVTTPDHCLPAGIDSPAVRKWGDLGRTRAAGSQFQVPQDYGHIFAMLFAEPQTLDFDGCETVTRAFDFGIRTETVTYSAKISPLEIKGATKAFLIEQEVVNTETEAGNFPLTPLADRTIIIAGEAGGRGFTIVSNTQAPVDMIVSLARLQVQKLA